MALYEVRFIHPISNPRREYDFRDLTISDEMSRDRKALGAYLRATRILPSGARIGELHTTVTARDDAPMITRIVLFPLRAIGMHSVTLTRLATAADVQAHLCQLQCEAGDYATQRNRLRTQGCEYSADQAEIRRVQALAHAADIERRTAPKVTILRDDLWLCSECTCAACNGDVTGVSSDERVARIWKGLEAFGTGLALNCDSETGEGIEERYYQACAVCGEDICGEATRFALFSRESAVQS